MKYASSLGGGPAGFQWNQRQLMTSNEGNEFGKNHESKFMVSIVVPAYNEVSNLELLVKCLEDQVSSYERYEILIVDDGSTDGTPIALRNLVVQYPNLRYISLSKNFGHQYALRAGIDHAEGDCIICLDADFQHPPELVTAMVEEWQGGADVVSCIRREQISLSLFKRLTSKLFYAVINRLSGLSLEEGSSDFRLIDRKVADVLSNLREIDIFYRGIIPLLGFKCSKIYYTPNQRRHGSSKYSLSKMMGLALSGVLSTSHKPLRMSIYFAFTTASLSAMFLVYVLYTFFASSAAVPGWASTMGVILIIGTMQLVVLGAIGEYLGQVLKEIRGRPPYLVDEAGSGVKHSKREFVSSTAKASLCDQESD